MIKDVFQLKKNSWHAKLMKFTWNLDTRDFSYMCPYFWLTAFNVIFIPVILLLKGFVKIVVFVIDKIEEINDIRSEQWNQAYYHILKHNPDEQLKLLRMDFDNKKNRKYVNFLFFFLGRIDYNWKNKLIDDRLTERHKIKTELYNSLANGAIKTSKERINSILKIIKPVVRVILILISAAVLFLIGCILDWFVLYLVHLPSSSWVKVIKSVTGVIVGFIICAIIYHLFSYLNETSGSKIGKIISYPFRVIWKIITKTIQFIAAMIKESCPAIKWVD